MKTIKNENDRANLIQRLSKLNGSERALWGKMNVHQMVSHLVQTAELPFGHSLEDKGNFVTKNIVKPLVLYILPMPKEVKTSPAINQQEKGRKPLEFAEDKKLAINFIEKIGALPVDFPCASHFVFGKMNAKEWGLLVHKHHKHVDHHLKQLGV